MRHPGADGKRLLRITELEPHFMLKPLTVRLHQWLAEVLVQNRQELHLKGFREVHHNLLQLIPYTHLTY